jgi:hypothetical protein
VTHALVGGEHIEVPGIGVDFEVLAVPGHTRGHLAYYGPSLAEHGALFCGDTLFGAGCGRLFDGTPAQMQESLAQLAVLPAPTLVYCAHEYTQSNLRFAAVVEPGSIAVQKRAEEVAAARAARRATVPTRIRHRTRNQSLPALGCAGRARRRRRRLGHAPADAWKPSPRSANGRTAFERTEPAAVTTRRNFIKALASLPPVLAYRPAWAQNKTGPDPSRLALVIGNSEYPSSPLGNPVNDAKAVGDTAHAGRLHGRFAAQCHAPGHDRRHRALRRRRQAFRNRQVMFYYAGHGAQLDWRNYLLPVDAMVEKQEHMKQRCVDLGLLLGQFSAARDKTFIVILDACRNNPFRQRLPAEQKGLSQFDAPVGSLLAYATSPGNVASDGEGAERALHRKPGARTVAATIPASKTR